MPTRGFGEGDGFARRRKPVPAYLLALLKRAR